MEQALAAVRTATVGTAYEGQLFVVGGMVRDDLLGRPLSSDADLVTTLSAVDLAEDLFKEGVTTYAPVTYPRFGTAMVEIAGTRIEFVTARSESYDPTSRKPVVTPATLEDDAFRRDFTVNALMRNLHSGELLDLTGMGLDDLHSRLLRTPKEPRQTFRDDPLRMLRAVRFRWQLGFAPADGLYEAIREESERLKVISEERIKEELSKMLLRPTAADALSDLMSLQLLDQFAPEFRAMVGVEQGKYHHLDVWEHTLAAVRNVPAGDLNLTLAALLHDVGKPSTRSVDAAGNIRFFGHEAVGAEMAAKLLRRLKFSNEDVATVAKLVKNHMRLGSAPEFSAPAARRLIRDLGPDVERLLALVDADSNALKAGVKVMDLSAIRTRLAEVSIKTPPHSFHSPLSGDQIMDEFGLSPGPELGRAKTFLEERVLDGDLAPDDEDAARHLLAAYLADNKSDTN